MGAQTLGIVSSLTIHASFLILVLLVPGAAVTPLPGTIHISLVHQDSTNARDREGSGQVLSKPKAPVRKNAPFPSKQTEEFFENQSKPVVAEANSEPAAGWNVPLEGSTLSPSRTPGNENAGKANTGLNTAGNSGDRIIMETGFGMSGAPAFIHQVIPVYPPLARRLGKEGRVVLRLFIDHHGKLQDIEVLEADGFGFREAAIDAVRLSTFRPASRNGEAVSARAILPVRFRLKVN